MAKTATLNLRIDPALKKAAARSAAKDGRTLTGWIEKLIAENAKEA